MPLTATTSHIELTSRNSGAKVLVHIDSIIEITGDANGSVLQISLHPTQRQLIVAESYDDIKNALDTITT